MTYAAFDIETTVRTRFKRKASPFGAGNWIVALGYVKQGQEQHLHYFGEKPPADGWMKDVLSGVTLLCGVNIKFDILHAIQTPLNYEAWMDWIVAGGQLWDCQLAEYLLNGMGQKDHMLSMDELAPRYGGDVKIDEVKALWAAGYDTHEIPEHLLMRYLGGGPDEHGAHNKGDIRNTEAIAVAQIKRARSEGGLRSIMLNMGSLVFTIEAEHNGMYADKERGLVLAEELRVKIEEIRGLLEQYLPADLPFEFKWTSRFHKSALIFGGPIKYDRREYLLKDGTYTWTGPGIGRESLYAYAQKEETHYILEDGSTVECSWFEHAWHAEAREDTRVRFTNGKNKGEPKTKKVKVDDRTKPKSRIGQDTFVFPGFTTGEKRWETSEPGVYSVSDDVIEELGVRNIPFLKALAQLQALTKDLGTYYITFDENGEAKGMLSLVDEHGLIHHKINHTSTVTGRFSSSDPNLQNIPKGKKSKIKTVFVSRFREDGVIVQSDFSALEVYIQAILTGCEQLIADLRAGLDMHVKRLAVKEQRPYDELLKLCKGYTDEQGTWHAPVEEWDYKRTGAKVFSFQRAYGAGAAKIAASTGMPVEDVQALIAAEALEYPEIDQYYIDLTDTIKQNRRPTGRAVPHPDVPGVMCHLGESSNRTPDGKLYSYMEHPAPEFLINDKHGRRRKDAVYSSFSPTEIRNYVVQGEGGEWMKAAMWLAVRAFYARRNFGGKALLVNTVHDAAYADCHKSVALEAAALLHACMEAASDFMEWYFSWPIPVPVPSDTTWGDSMAVEDKIPGLNELAGPLRAQLRATYMKGYKPSYLC